MYVHGVQLGVGKDWIFVDKIKSIGWGGIDVFIFEDLHSSPHKKSVLIRKKRSLKRGKVGGNPTEIALRVSEGSKVRLPRERWSEAGPVSILNNFLTHLQHSLDKNLKNLGVCDQLSQFSKSLKLSLVYNLYHIVVYL